MYIVLLKFSDDRGQAGALMEAHNTWLKRGFDEGAFILAGSLVPGLGGALLAQGMALDALRERVDEDPFVAANVVSAEILEIAPSKADARMQFLLS
ncbi:YciI family protein [Pseudoxanthomonas japonensis]|uniref:YCII-related domain-containing protein n=1 Tax=Pseudoxanthomonas japonensis TaxID=69284 RepID=A0ABQ6ZK98_9GAMM|nr:YciI family protein [Pseudoxanthomonas japonensis]KAF1726615.1 hypothetical protein CSC78_03420 [Pseudoxanthomonas japonensis]